MYIDTHAHIFDEYYNNIEKVLNGALENKVSSIIISGCDMDSNREVIKKIEKYEMLYGTIGFHPENVLLFKKENLKFLEDNLNNKKIVALGEIGLDYHYEDCNRDKQKEILIKQLEIAVKYNKPVVIHCRDATADMIDILSKYKGKIKGVMHCFSGSLETANIIINLGFYIGVGGIITFKNAKNIIDVIKNIDLKYILLETDCPYLTPEPYRGVLNEPKYIPIIASKIALVKGIDNDKVSAITTNNAKSLFDI